jgi:hypothetical protein
MVADDVIGVGIANDLVEPGLVQTVAENYSKGLCQYLTIYIYENYTTDFLRNIRAAMPAGFKFVWHASGDFEIPYDGSSIDTNWDRISFVSDLFKPEWATEDIIITNFARSRPQGHPNYVQPFLTEECLAVCVRRMKEVEQRLPVRFYPEVPHFYMPGPDEMHLSTFFSRFVEETGAYLNFDLGHFFSYNLLNGLPLLHRIEEFPLEHVGEINTAGGMIGDADGVTWIDDYAGPINPVSEKALRLVLPRCKALRAIYTETIGAPPWVLQYNLERLNDLFWSTR